jgi:hypothetical protein
VLGVVRVQQVVIVVERYIDPVLVRPRTAPCGLVILASVRPCVLDSNVRRRERDQAAEVDVGCFGVRREGERQARCYEGVEVGVERSASYRLVRDGKRKKWNTKSRTASQS